MNGLRGTLFTDSIVLSRRIPRERAQRGVLTTCSRVRHWLAAHYWWLWTFVGAVSLYDAWLVIVFRDMIHQTEKNPLGRLLIQLDSNGIAYFLTAKALGTVIVMLALAAVQQLAHRHREWIIGGVASFQAWLLWYLSFAGPPAN